MFFLVSESVVGNSVIFPKSAVAFLIIASDDILKQSNPVVLDAEVFERYSIKVIAN